MRLYYSTLHLLSETKTKPKPTLTQFLNLIILGLRFEVSQTIPDFLEIFVPEDDLCTLEIVESIPQGLVYNNSKPHLSTFQVSLKPNFVKECLNFFFEFATLFIFLGLGEIIENHK